MYMYYVYVRATTASQPHPPARPRPPYIAHIAIGARPRHAVVRGARKQLISHSRMRIFDIHAALHFEATGCFTIYITRYCHSYQNVLISKTFHERSRNEEWKRPTTATELSTRPATKCQQLAFLWRTLQCYRWKKTTD